MREIARIFVAAIVGVVLLHSFAIAQTRAVDLISRPSSSGNGTDLMSLIVKYCPPGRGTIVCPKINSADMNELYVCTDKPFNAFNYDAAAVAAAKEGAIAYCASKSKTTVARTPAAQQKSPVAPSSEQEEKGREIEVRVDRCGRFGGAKTVTNTECTCKNGFDKTLIDVLDSNGKTYKGVAVCCPIGTKPEKNGTTCEASVASYDESPRAEIASVMVAPTEEGLRDKYCVVGDTNKINCGALSRDWVEAFGCKMKIGINKKVAEQDIKNYCESLGPEPDDNVPGSEEDFRRGECEGSKGYSRYISGGTCECKDGFSKLSKVSTNNNSIYHNVQICDVCSDGMEPNESGNGCKYTETTEYNACIAEKPNGAYWGGDQTNPVPHCICADALKKWDGKSCVATTDTEEVSGDEEKKFLADFNDITDLFFDRARGLIDSMGKAKPSAK